MAHEASPGTQDLTLETRVELRRAPHNTANGSNAKETRFSRLGGAAAVDRLVEAFYVRMDRLPEAKTIRALHPQDLSATKDVLKRYLGEWMGGPPLYSQERGHPRLRMRHIGFKIGEAERDAWLLCMRGALNEVTADAELRDDLFEAFSKLADWMRNQPGNPHDRASP